MNKLRYVRQRVITVAFEAHVGEQWLKNAKADDDVKSLKWISVKKLPKLAFDHSRIVSNLLFDWEDKGLDF